MNINTGGYHLSDDQLCIMAVYRDPLVQYNLSLSQIEIVEVAFLSIHEPELGKRPLNSFEGWFLEHCMNRQIRPVEALKEFQGSKSFLIRQIATKVLAEKYAIFESDKTDAAIARYTMWTMWATLATALIATITLMVSCSSGGQAKTTKVEGKSVSH